MRPARAGHGGPRSSRHPPKRAAGAGGTAPSSSRPSPPAATRPGRGRRPLELLVRSPLVVIADAVVGAAGPPATVDDLAGAGSVLLERPGGSMLLFANPDPGSGLFVWATNGSLAVVADPGSDAPLEGAGQLTVCSGRLVVGPPDGGGRLGAHVGTGAR